VADRLPELRQLRWIRFEGDRPVEKSEALVDLVATDGQLCGPPQPEESALSEFRQFGFLA
jgi:hypothetical protein